jgi:hypothetical protein
MLPTRTPPSFSSAAKQNVVDDDLDPEHLRQHRVDAVEHAVEVGPDQPLPGFRRQLPQGAFFEARAGVVDRDVDATCR